MAVLREVAFAEGPTQLQGVIMLTKWRLRFTRGSVIAIIPMALAVVLAIPAGVATAASTAPGSPSMTGPSPGPSGGDGVLSTTLVPLGGGTGGTSPAAAPVIACSLYLGQYPHLSSGAVSWHATWSCSEYAYAKGSLTLYVGNFPVANSYPSQYGLKGDMNVRHSCSPSPAYWTYQGSAVVTFSAPGYTSATVQGYSPTARILCA
jgi:hypothetical protein